MVLALCKVAHFHRHNRPVERQPHFAERLHALPERLIRLPKRLRVAGQQVCAGIERQRLNFPDDGQCALRVNGFVCALEELLRRFAASAPQAAIRRASCVACIHTMQRVLSSFACLSRVVGSVHQMRPPAAAISASRISSSHGTSGGGLSGGAGAGSGVFVGRFASGEGDGAGDGVLVGSCEADESSISGEGEGVGDGDGEGEGDGETEGVGRSSGWLGADEAFCVDVHGVASNVTQPTPRK